MDNIEVGKRLITARGEKAQKMVASELGISQSSLAMYESGRRIPRDALKEKIARFYGKTVGSLFFNE